MAVLLTKKLNNITEYPNAFKRQGAFPLEADSIYQTLADAQKYAKEDPIAYVTQLLAVAAEDGTVVYYVIADEEGNLFKLGSSEMDLDELDRRLDEIEKFFAKLDGKSFDKALDTLIEVQERINLIYDDKDAENNAKEPSGLLVNETNRAIAAEENLNKKINDLDFEYDAKSESKNKTYFVKTVAQKDGLVAITREQLPDIEISATTATATTLSNGGSFTVLTSIDEVEDTTNTDNGHKILKTAKQFTIPTIAIEPNDNLTLSATTGKITIGHSTALAGNDAATNEVVANSSATLQLKDTDGLKFVKTTYDANGHKNGSTQTEYKMPKLTTWTWTSTATQVTATLGGKGITTLNIPNMPFASTTQSGVVSATTQSFAGDKTFTGTVTIDKDLIVNGTTTSVDFETAVTKENLIIANADGGSIAGKLSGLAIRVNNKNTENAYGVVYDTSNDVIKLGLGTVNENNGYEFTFKKDEDETIATREWVNKTSAPIAHASTTTTYGVASTTHYGHVKSASASPSAHNATASVGSKTDVYAREDHVHPVSALTIKFATATTNNTSATTTFNTSAAATVTIGPASIGVSPGATKVESSTINGNIKIDNVEKTVYTHPSYTAATQAKVYNITVDSKGHVDSASIADAGDLLMTGYTANSATTGLSVATTDTVSSAIAKLEQSIIVKNQALTTALQNYVDAIDALVGGN